MNKSKYPEETTKDAEPPEMYGIGAGLNVFGTSDVEQSSFIPVIVKVF